MMYYYYFFHLNEIQFTGGTDARVVSTTTTRKNSNCGADADGGVPEQKALELLCRWKLCVPGVPNTDAEKHNLSALNDRINSHIAFIEPRLNLISLYASVTKTKSITNVRGSQRNVDTKGKHSQGLIVSRKCPLRWWLCRGPPSIPQLSPQTPARRSLSQHHSDGEGLPRGFPQIPYPTSP